MCSAADAQHREQELGVFSCLLVLTISYYPPSEAVPAPEWWAVWVQIIRPLRGVRRWDRYVSRGTQLPFHALQTGYLQYHNTNVLYSALASAVHCSLRAIFVAVRSADRRLGLTERRKSNSAEDTVRHHPAFTHFVVCTTTDRNDISAGSSQRSPDISTLLQSPSALLAGCCNLQPTSQVEFARKEHSAEKSWWFAMGG